MNHSRQKTDSVIRIHPTLMRSRWPLSEYHWMTFAGVASPSGAPLKSNDRPDDEEDDVQQAAQNGPARHATRAGGSDCSFHGTSF